MIKKLIERKQTQTQPKHSKLFYCLLGDVPQNANTICRKKMLILKRNGCNKNGSKK